MKLSSSNVNQMNNWFMNKVNKVSLSTKLLILTVLFVMLAEILIFVPSVANFRKTWLEERLAAAQIAALAVEASSGQRTAKNVAKRVTEKCPGVYGSITPGRCQAPCACTNQ